ncbi:hypothetical protein NITGR_280100 [Nitrospina gracilis 3/211]|uniref:ParB/Sulfiredoxin domain-containing protein n=1 Tax=Nitrospina gracilis (strain 3/211) TaxID=1266370 RepID=M1YXG7_NITG3|nr:MULTISPECIES: hypothetical protein [Nitrospina]MCF8723333.1 hypothetical protein [Nitrospina sp. Nb-3]CCQ90384.1 hypothetical protein NITGR_280100 [Nitrospina gracilis 3/211]
MTTRPSFLLENPEPPKIRQRLYNGRKLMVWDGKVNISSILGWVDNPRIELAKKTMQEKVGYRALSQDEVFELMKNSPEVKLKELRDDIIKNGLREPLTLSFQGKLLDGNRRFFAIKYALEIMTVADPNKQDLETIDVHVLTEEASEEDEQNVLVEENFSASLKIEWPEYVKALKVVDAHESGLDINDISKKYSWAKSKIKQTLKIHQIITDYITFATADVDPEDEYGGGLGMTEQDAENEAAKNYQFFNEAQKSFFEQLNTEIDFKIQFFKWIHEGKFSSFQEVRIAYNAWRHPEAKAALLQPDPTAAKSAKAILDYNTRVVKSTDEAVGRIDNFVKFLREMTAQQIDIIPEASLENLKESLELVIKMGEATSKK